VTLIVRNAGGGEARVTHDVLINPSAPIAAFGYSAASATRQVTFTYRATADGGTPATYEWDFGDGSSATGPSVSHTFADDGPFNVRLRVTNVTGNDQVTQSVSLAVPDVDFSHPATIQAGTAVTFTNTSTGGPFASITWNWDDGTANGTGATASHRFADPGTYAVTVTVVNGRGSFSQTKQITVTG
jgi:PKD repeat protein